MKAIDLIRGHYIQIGLFVTIVINQIAALWNDDQQRFVSWSGKIGFTLKYHYWLIFDYWSQVYAYGFLIILALVYPLSPTKRAYAISTIILYFSIVTIEKLRYLYHGDNLINEVHFFTYLAGYTVGIIILYFKSKPWMQ